MWTDIAHDVQADDQRKVSMLATVNTMEALSAVVWDPARHTIRERCIQPVYEDIAQSWAKVLATAAVIQYASLLDD